MSFQVPFEARGVQDFPVHPIEVGVEYTVLDVSEDGSRFQARLPDGTLAWFPSKLVRIVKDTPQKPQHQTSYNTHNTYNNHSPTYNTHNTYNNHSPAYNTHSNHVHLTDTQREHEAAKRAAAEKERRRAELKQKLRQQTNTPVRKGDNVDDDVDQATRQLERMKTYTENRGYLATAPGFSNDLSKYIDNDREDDEPEVYQTSKTATNKATQTNTLNSPAYRKVDERADGPKYVPTDNLPAQYQTNSAWKCHSCQTTNSASSPKCGMCGTLRSEKSIAVDEASSAPGIEWTCSSCKVSNPPSRGACSMCGTKYKPAPTQTTPKTSKDPKDKKTPAGSVKKKTIVTKAGSGVELQYAKGVDNYREGGFVPGHGAGY